MSKRRRTGRVLVDTTEDVTYEGDVEFTQPTLFSSVLTPILNTPTSSMTIGAAGKTLDFNGSTITNFTAFPPAGAVLPYAGSSTPSGYHLCDGASIAVASFPALFAAIGYTYGGGGANFNVPDLRGRTVIGAGAGPGLTNRVLAAQGGQETVTLDTSTMPSHNHIIQAEASTQNGTSVSNSYLCDATYPGPYSGGLYSTTQMGGDMVGYSGGNAAHENMQPFKVLNYIIKT